jgi:outer membrane autotransporter protein
MLRVNGQLTSPSVGVQSGGTLTGNGTVVGTVTNNSGGNVQVDSGTLAFNGNYIHQMGAFFTVGVTPSTNGVLAVTGAGHTADIQGGTVRVMAGVGSYAPSTQYTILTATGGVSGTFSGWTSNFAFLDPSLTYDANNVYLTLVRNSIDFASVGVTPNQISAGGGLAALGMSNPIVSAALMLTPDQARAAFDSVSGEIHPSLHALMLDESALVRDAILGRQRLDAAQGSTGAQATGFADEDEAALAYARKARKAKAGPKWPIKAPPPVIAPVYGAWVQGYGNWTRLNSDGNAAALRSTNGGAIGGVDVTLNHNWRFGVATGGGRTDARVDARLSSGTIDTFHIAAYGGGRIGDILFRTGAAYAHHDISTTRTIAFPGFADTATANYNASTAQIFGEAAYRFYASWLNAEAFADLAHVNVRSDGFTETGGPAALSVAQADTSATFTTLGVRAQAPIPAFGPWMATARGSLGWQHAYDNVAPVALMSFAASPAPFAISGVPIATDALLVEAGLDALVHRNTVIALLYTGRIAADASAHAVRANVAVKF